MARYGRSTTYRCGGYSSYTGHCGAGDCETCHPGGAAQMAAEEAREEWESEFLAPLQEELASLETTIAAAHELHLDTSALEASRDLLETHIEEVEDDAPDFDADGYDDYDGPDEDDGYDYRAEDLEEHGMDSQYY